MARPPYGNEPDLARDPELAALQSSVAYRSLNAHERTLWSVASRFAVGKRDENDQVLCEP
jgi:hypothetical protein